MSPQVRNQAPRAVGQVRLILALRMRAQNSEQSILAGPLKVQPVWLLLHAHQQRQYDPDVRFRRDQQMVLPHHTLSLERGIGGQILLLGPQLQNPTALRAIRGK